MANNNNVPREMGKSPIKGEPTPQQTCTKHSHYYVPRIDEQTTTSALGEKYSEDVFNVEGKICAQKKAGDRGEWKVDSSDWGG